MDDFQFYTLVFTLLASFYAAIFIRHRGKKKNLPPSPPALPVIGNLHQLGQLPHRSLWNLSRKHGPLMLLHLGSKPTLVVSSAAAAKEIFKNHDVAFADRPKLSSCMKIFYGSKDVINLPYGEQWRKLRSIFVQHMLNSRRLKSFSCVRDEEIGVLMEKIRDLSMSSRPVNLSKMLVSLTNDLICRAAIGKKQSESEDGKKFVEGMDEIVPLLFSFTVGEFVPWLGWINRLNGFDATLDKCAEKRDEILDAVIEDHLKNRRSPEESKENFVDILLGIYKGNTPGVSIDLIAVKAVILDVFGAGTDTSATTMVWVMTELIRNPRVMKKLKDEVKDITKGNYQQQHIITNDDIKKMHYLKAVIKETLRYHPPAAIIYHATRECVNLMGYDIAPETMVLINAWAIGRDPACWDEPEKFMPERFLNSSVVVDYRGFDFQFIPFGAGRRICPGLGFAVDTVEHTLANLVHKFDWALPDHRVKGEDLDATERAGMTIGRKNPLILVATINSTAA